MHANSNTDIGNTRSCTLHRSKEADLKTGTRATAGSWTPSLLKQQVASCQTTSKMLELHERLLSSFIGHGVLSVSLAKKKKIKAASLKGRLSITSTIRDLV